MTREDAIYEIKQLAVLSTNKNIERITEALNMAIEALQTEPTISKMEQVDEPQTEPLPKTINGVRIADAVAWADKWLEDNSVSEMWDMIRTLRDATEWQDEPQTDFLTFLYNVINPNEMEEYRAMYEAKGIATKDESQTSGVVWTEDAIKNEPKSYTTWASTDEPQTDCAWR